MSGFWVKQGNNEGNDMIYAKSLNSKTMEFNDVIVFKFNRDYEVRERIKAEISELHDNYWLLKNTEVINIGEIVFKDEIKLGTSITKIRLKKDFPRLSHYPCGT